MLCAASCRALGAQEQPPFRQSWGMKCPLENLTGAFRFSLPFPRHARGGCTCRRSLNFKAPDLKTLPWIPPEAACEGLCRWLGAAPVAQRTRPRHLQGTKPQDCHLCARERS